MSKHKATHVQASNFAYDLTARTFNDANQKASRTTTNLNLSSIKHMISGAEPINKYGLSNKVI